jgi:hypothetical protein
MAAPVFPPKPEEAADDPHPWSLGKIWVLEPGEKAGCLWAGTMPGGLFRSDDSGNSWSLNVAQTSLDGHSINWPVSGAGSARIPYLGL